MSPLLAIPAAQVWISVSDPCSCHLSCLCLCLCAFALSIFALALSASTSLSRPCQTRNLTLRLIDIHWRPSRSSPQRCVTSEVERSNIASARKPSIAGLRPATPSHKHGPYCFRFGGCPVDPRSPGVEDPPPALFLTSGKVTDLGWVGVEPFFRRGGGSDLKVAKTRCEWSTTSGFSKERQAFADFGHRTNS